MEECGPVNQARGAAVRLSFCITAMDRLHHIRQTLPANIASNQTCDGIEFVLLDYSSRDSLAEWVRSELSEYIRTGRLTFVQALGFTEFKMAHAKNIAHRAAHGEIVCNLDADNYTGDGFGRYLIEQFAKFPNSYVRAAGPRGSSGRIAFLKRQFEALGGYDERMIYGWGYEDGDLYERAKASGLKECLISNNDAYFKVIRHDVSESTKNYLEKNRRASQAKHRAISRESLRKGELIANRTRPWGSGHLVINFAAEL